MAKPRSPNQLEARIKKITSRYDSCRSYIEVDGTCMLLHTSTIKAVGFLDPTFRAPGWGADVDYSHRVTQAGLELYVSHRAMVWHPKEAGGTSAEQIYGGKREWLRKGLKQVKEDMETKYGFDWRDIMPMPRDQFDKPD